ncbi:MAG: hypothetical protein IPN85_18660 [Flavobacteriales bacterium]|nr:hypothetical protein [Flavobacteriales bacterium]
MNATGGQSYAWSPSAGLSDASIADPLAFPTASTTYTVTVTDSIGCAAVDSATATVNPLPFADAGPDQTICPLESTPLFECPAPQVPPTSGAPLPD